MKTYVIIQVDYANAFYRVKHEELPKILNVLNLDGNVALDKKSLLGTDSNHIFERKKN